MSSASQTTSKVWGLSKKVAWLIGTSALVLVLPLLYEIDKELGPGVEPSPPGAGATPTAGAKASTPSDSS